MFALVADVERYPEFLPWVAALRIRSRTENIFTADVIAAFGALREKFTSKVTLDRETMTIGRYIRIARTISPSVRYSPQILAASSRFFEKP